MKTVEGVERDRDRNADQQHAAAEPYLSHAPAEDPDAVTGLLARKGKSQQRQGDTDGEEQREQEGTQADMMRGPDDRDGGEHRAGAGDIDQSEGEAQAEPLAARPNRPALQPGEGPLEQLADPGDQHSETDDDQHGDARVAQGVLGKAERAQDQ